MYWKHFGLAEDPFSLTADSRFLFLTDAHSEVLSTLRESVETERGFAALIAPPGVGKTTLLYELIEQLRETTVVAFIFQTNFEPIDILRLLLKELGLDTAKADVVSLHQQFADALGRVAVMGKRFALVIDEAQALSPAALETIRLLSNFDLNRKKPVQVVLAGQHEFEELLARPGLQHIKQRIAAYGRLRPFTKDKTREYVVHRLRVAGGADQFTAEALDVLANLSHGVARTINIYGFQALHAAIKSGAKSADSEVTRRAIHEFEGWPLPNAAPALERRVPPAAEMKTSRASFEDDDYFEGSKEPGLQALLDSIRGDRTREDCPVSTESVEPAIPLSPVVAPQPAFAPAVAKAEPIPFSIAAVIKTIESIHPTAVNRTAAAVAPVLEPPVAPQKQEPPVVAEPVGKPVPKAPVLVVPTPIAGPGPVGVKQEPIPIASAKSGAKPTVTASPTRIWQDRRMQLYAAGALIALLLGGSTAVAYMRGWFRTAPTASAAPMNQPAAATTSAPAAVESNVTGRSSAAPEVGHVSTPGEPTPQMPRKATPPAATAPASATATAVAEISTGKTRRLNDVEPAPAPPVSLDGVAQPNLSSALGAASQPLAALPTKVSEVKPAVVTAQPKPVYPDMANRLAITGMVVLKVQVNAQGRPTKVDVISGHPVLAAAAKNTVLAGWRFSPASLSGKPVESETEVRINFRGSR
jgi:TonB family protein